MLTRRMLLPLLAAGAATACSKQAAQSPLAAAAPAAPATGITPPTATGMTGTAAPGASSAPTLEGTLVVVFQRFAADWMNLLVPMGDPAYTTARPNLAITNPLPLDGFFGLHPALTDLKTLFDVGSLGFVAATGWVPTDSRDRSHFFAQSIAESGARSGVSSGWLGRVMQRDTNHNDDIWAALAAESSVPNSLQGFANAIAVRDFADYNHGSVMADAATGLQQTLAEIAGAPGEPVNRLARSIGALAAEPLPAPTITYPVNSLGQGLKVAAQAIKGGLAPRVITITSDDDWDTHVNQLSRHNTSLPAFAAAFKAFNDDMGALMGKVTVVTMTEFGRKAVENLGGTDHGTASSMLVMGGQVTGGKVYGQWPGMESSKLYQGEDLEPTTDFRSVLGEILVKRLGVAEAELEAVFPGGYAASANWRQFHR